MLLILIFDQFLQTVFRNSSSTVAIIYNKKSIVTTHIYAEYHDRLTKERFICRLGVGEKIYFLWVGHHDTVQYKKIGGCQASLEGHFLKIFQSIG